MSESEIQSSVIRELAGNLPNTLGHWLLGGCPSHTGINVLHNAQNPFMAGSELEAQRAATDREKGSVTGRC